MFAWKLFLILAIIAIEEAISFMPLTLEETCVPTTVVKGLCHTCICGADGVFQCTKQSCIPQPTNTTTPTPHPTSTDQLPDITDGQTCTPGKAYKMDCNICKCGTNNSLICTKKACFNKEEMDHFMAYRKSKQREEGKKRSRRNSSRPKLPKGKCVPGKIYSRGCNRCFCTDAGIAICTNIACTKSKKLKKNAEDSMGFTLESIRPPYTEKEVEKLPELPTISARCEPGKGYRLDCNQCACTNERILICTQIYCISFEDINRLAAKKISGKTCQDDDSIKKAECVKCTCVKGKSKCEPVQGCSPERIVKAAAGSRRLHGKVEDDVDAPKTRLNLTPKDHCIPGAVYKDKCNKCYCQEDKSLRCTQKACLNYVESLKLKKHRLFLEKNGL